MKKILVDGIPVSVERIAFLHPTDLKPLALKDKEIAFSLMEDESGHILQILVDADNGKTSYVHSKIVKACKLTFNGVMDEKDPVNKGRSEIRVLGNTIEDFIKALKNNGLKVEEIECRELLIEDVLVRTEECRCDFNVFIKGKNSNTSHVHQQILLAGLHALSSVSDITRLDLNGESRINFFLANYDDFISALRKYEISFEEINETITA